MKLTIRRKNMRLYKIELYKLCRKKLFSAGLVCIIAFLLLVFLQHLNSAVSTVNGTKYRGYEAVMADRQITEEFKGTLTDKKLQLIADKYGFPQISEQSGEITNENFLNRFVMNYASDGYLHDRNDYQAATKVLPLADSQLSEVHDFTGEDIYLACFTGWDSYREWYYMCLLLVSILILYSVATVFSAEEQTGTKPLLFTTQEGPAKDMAAKFAAAYTLSIGLWAVITLSGLFLYGMVYGWDSFSCLSTLVSGWNEPLIPFGTLLVQTYALSLLGILELCALTLCMSACFHSAFHSVSAAGACWGLPLLVLPLLHGIYRVLLASSLEASTLTLWGRILFPVHILVYASPFFMINHNTISELDALTSGQTGRMIWITAVSAAIVTVLCAVTAYYKYRKVRIK